MAEKWWTYPADGENGKTVLVTGRDGIDKFRESGKYIYRINVSLKYTELSNGLPTEEESRQLEHITDALISAFNKDKVAVMTGIYTGEGVRDWVFYSKNLAIFGHVFNKALYDLPLLPLKIEAEEDKDWEEYLTMRDATYIPDED